jgi:hypothetical protein
VIQAEDGVKRSEHRVIYAECRVANCIR